MRKMIAVSRRGLLAALLVCAALALSPTPGSAYHDDPVINKLLAEQSQLWQQVNRCKADLLKAYENDDDAGKEKALDCMKKALDRIGEISRELKQILNAVNVHEPHR